MSATTESADDQTTVREPDEQLPPTRRAWVGPAALVAVAAALVAFGIVALVRANTLRHDGPVANDALVDRSATGQVIGQVTTALNQVLSYDYTKPQVAQTAAKRWLAGDAPGQYKILFAQLQQAARGQSLTLQAKVVTAAVSSLKGDTAQLLVFVDQQSTRASDHQSSVSAAQIRITATKNGSGWKVTELVPL